MTDKQIIIDGIDVSGCEFYSRCTDQCLDYRRWYNKPLCKHLPDCHYKQLKRKEQECETLASQLDFEVQKKECLEQECEELKEQLERADEDIKMKCTRCAMTNQLDEQLDQLKAENEELRQFLSKEPLAIQALQKSYESYQKSAKVFSDWVKDYKQLITEIKEIAKNGCYDDCGMPLDELSIILQKISEVEDETTK